MGLENLLKKIKKGKNFVKKGLIAGLITSSLLFSCNVNPPSPKPKPRSQELEITVDYSGTAKTISPFEKHNIYFGLCKDGEGYAVNYFPANPNDLISGHTYNFGMSIEPGNYELYVDWDWNNNTGIDSFEPRGNPYPLEFNMDGFSTKKLNIEIIDRTNPTDLGWIEGTIDYNNNPQNYPLYVVVKDEDYNDIVKKSVNLLGNLIALPNNGKFYYICKDVPPGGPYRAISFLDVNWDGQYDSNDIRSDFYFGPFGGFFVVSPGLPTVGIDMTLN